LLRYRQQRQTLVDRPALIPDAIEELLRYDAPLQRTFRVASDDIQIGTASIKKGQIVSMMLGAANRDPAVWANPDDLDVTRPPNRHLGFGQGIHYCVGAPLARLEVGIAISSLVHQLPSMILASDRLEYQPTLGLRALKAL